MEKYPNDVLPRFYLGVAKSLTGYGGIREAESHLRKVLESRVESLRLTAMYNLAATFIEAYTSESFHRAQILLEDLIGELRKKRSNVSVYGALLTKLRRRRYDARDELLFQAWAVLLYSQIHGTLWAKRDTGSLEELASDIAARKQGLDQFKAEFDEAGGEQIPGSREIFADYANDWGMYEWSLASLHRTTDSAESRRRGEAAVKWFDEALSKKPNWPPARANKAGVYEEVLGDDDKAIELWTELTRGLAQAEFACYNLGKIYAKKKEYRRAVEWLEKADPIPGAEPERARILQEHLGSPAEARAIWEAILKNDPNNQAAHNALREL